LTSAVKRASLALEGAMDLRDDVLRRMIEVFRPKIQAIFAKAGSEANVNELERFLLANGIPREVVTFLKKRGMKLPPKPTE